jgi:hypothetical protein
MSFEISPFTFQTPILRAALPADAKMQTYGPKSFSSGAFSFQGAFLFGLNLDPICAFMRAFGK